MEKYNIRMNMAHCRQKGYVNVLCMLLQLCTRQNLSTHLAVTCNEICTSTAPLTHTHAHTVSPHLTSICCPRHAKLALGLFSPGCQPNFFTFSFFFSFSHLVRINSFFAFSFAERRGERISPTVEEGKFFSFKTHRLFPWAWMIMARASATWDSFRT